MYIVIDYTHERKTMQGYFNENLALNKMRELGKQEGANVVCIDLDRCRWTSNLTLKNIAEGVIRC